METKSATGNLGPWCEEANHHSANLLDFVKPTLFIDNTFWHKLFNVKLDIDGSIIKIHKIWGYLNFKSNEEPILLIDYSSLNSKPDQRRQLTVGGYIKNMNTYEAYKNIQNYEDFVQHIQNNLLEDMHNGKIADLRFIAPFILYTYADLKQFQFHYKFHWITFEDKLFYLIRDPIKWDTVFSADQKQLFTTQFNALESHKKSMFFIKLKNDDLEVIDFSTDESNHEGLYAVLTDFSISGGNRISMLSNNTLLYILQIYPEWFNGGLKVACIRQGPRRTVDVILYHVGKLNTTLSKTFTTPPFEFDEYGQQKSHFVNLRESMDPRKVWSELCNLNLKLMKWNVEPNLNLNIFSNTKCLLLGAGTLGCTIARLLMGWGVKHITFVDNGCISISNPLRQSLYRFEDVNKKGYKADTAAKELTSINPDIEAKGVCINIPTPGCSTELDMNAYSLLTELITENDVIFSLTDSKESRWLPSVISGSLKKLVITVALGYDSFLVMRHGIYNDSDLGCYFCSDVCAPGNSKNNRALDQQCTVTQPGVESIACGIAIQLFASILQHQDRYLADPESSSCLGGVPHCVRGFLNSLEFIHPTIKRYSSCTACSHPVINEFKVNGHVFVQNVLNDPTYLENLCGLTKMKLDTCDDQLLTFSSDEELSDENKMNRDIGAFT